jgi:hypothetical protein
MLNRFTALALLLVAMAALPGCSKVNFEQSLTLDPGGIKIYNIDAPRGDQKVRVQVDSREPIDIDVALESASAEAQLFLQRERKTAGKDSAAPAGLLATKQGVTQGSVEASIPAGKGFTVLLSGAKKNTEVKLKVNSI